MSLPDRIAYIKTDPHEDPQALQELVSRLSEQSIYPLFTEQTWDRIKSKQPFLYYRNPYIRFDNERSVIDHHLENPTTSYITTADGELVSVGTVGPRESCSFVLRAGSYYHEPSYDPLPILVAAHRRPIYFQLTLNALLHNTQLSARQKIYIVASHPDPETEAIVRKAVDQHSKVEAVITRANLGYAYANFGSKFFDLDKFVHVEDDSILPENLHHKIPFWTSQLNYRSTTADYVSHRVSDINYEARFYRSDMMYRMKRMPTPPENVLWHYVRPEKLLMTPIGGQAAVIDAINNYKDFSEPDFCQTDHTLSHKIDLLCIVNVPVYHIGANQMMDYGDYTLQKHSWGKPDQLQAGQSLRTGKTKVVDLGVDYVARDGKLAT